MSNRNADKSELILGKRIWKVEGSFQALAGAGTVDATKVKGQGFGYGPFNGATILKAAASPGITSVPGIVRTGTGLYTVTLEDPYLDYITAQAWLMVPGATVNDAAVQTVPTNLATAGKAPTFTIVTFNGNSGAAADLGTTYNVCFRFVFRDSTVGYKP